ncbi:MAG: CoA pyrophosphatase [Acidocella sp.]|nr:CoA pyrophosphatase [Acidocella sp.]
MTAAELRAKLSTLVHTPLAVADHRQAAVLVALEPGRGVWLTRRTNDLPNHAGQVAFPGGKIETFDQSPEAAALREAWEEIGLAPAAVELLGRMDDHITGTGFHIAPVVGLITPGMVFHPAPGEVAAVFCLGFDVLLNPQAPQRRTLTMRGEERAVWVWPHTDHFIWGATAAILVNLAQLVRGAA